MINDIISIITADVYASRLTRMFVQKKTHTCFSNKHKKDQATMVMMMMMMGQELEAQEYLKHKLLLTRVMSLVPMCDFA